MLRKRSWMLLCMLLIPSMLLAACQQAAVPTAQIIEKTVIVQGTPQVIIQTAVPQPAEPQPAAPSLKVLRLDGGSADIPSIDPSHAVSMIEIQVIESTSLGIMRQNEETGEMEPGMAKSYEVSPDGLTYTFKLMDNVPWVKYDANKGQVVKVQDCNGADRMVTADDFAYGIKRTLDPLVASEYAYVLTPYLVGANEYNTSTETDPTKLAELADAVGVKVIDSQTISYTFLKPAVYNLNILGLWVAHAQPRWLIEGDDCTDARGERWTEAGFYQGYGPFTLKEWFHDANLTMIKNPFWPGSQVIPQAKIDEVTYRFLDTSVAFAEFEAGNLEIASIPSGDLDRIKSDPTYQPMIEQAITLGTEFYAFNTQKAPTDDARVRLALSLAIDRESLVNNVVKSGIPAPYYTNPGAAGAPKPDKYPDLGVKYDPTQAKALLDEYLKEKNLTADKLNVSLLFNTAESNKKAAEAIQAMWKDTLGINVTVTNQERKVFYQQRPLGLENVYRSSWVQDYPDANNFLYEVFGTPGGYQDIVKWNSGANFDKFISLLGQGAIEQDAAKRMDLYAQAEKILLNDEAVITPLWWYSDPQLVRPTVQKPTSITGYEHFEKWDITSE